MVSRSEGMKACVVVESGRNRRIGDRERGRVTGWECVIKGDGEECKGGATGACACGDARKGSCMPCEPLIEHFAARSSIGRVPASHAGGTGIETRRVQRDKLSLHRLPLFPFLSSSATSKPPSPFHNKHAAFVGTVESN